MSEDSLRKPEEFLDLSREYLVNALNNLRDGDTSAANTATLLSIAAALQSISKHLEGIGAQKSLFHPSRDHDEIMAEIS